MEQETNHILVTVDKFGMGQVVINGQRIKGVSRLELVADPGNRDLTTVTLTLIKYDVTVDAEGFVNYETK